MGLLAGNGALRLDRGASGLPRVDDQVILEPERAGEPDEERDREPREAPLQPAEVLALRDELQARV
jgi:hypothetical protein